MQAIDSGWDIFNLWDAKFLTFLGKDFDKTPLKILSEKNNVSYVNLNEIADWSKYIWLNYV